MTSKNKNFQAILGLDIKAKSRLAIAFFLFMVVAACDRFDTYSEKFQTIAIGDSRSSAVQVLGEPLSTSKVEAPLINVEQLAWRSHMSNKVYIVHTVMDRIVTKSIIE